MSSKAKMAHHSVQLPPLTPAVLQDEALASLQPGLQLVAELDIFEQRVPLSEEESVLALKVVGSNQWLLTSNPRAVRWVPCHQAKIWKGLAQEDTRFFATRHQLRWSARYSRRENTARHREHQTAAYTHARLLQELRARRALRSRLQSPPLYCHDAPESIMRCLLSLCTPAEEQGHRHLPAVKQGSQAVA